MWALFNIFHLDTMDIHSLIKISLSSYSSPHTGKWNVRPNEKGTGEECYIKLPFN